MPLLAHSAQDGVPEQPYREHILAVKQCAQRHIGAALQFFVGTPAEGDALSKAVHDGSLLHDLGKIDAENQAILRTPDCREALPLNHADAGTAFLCKRMAVNEIGRAHV